MGNDNKNNDLEIENNRLRNSIQTLTHDLRNPLAIAQQYLSLAKETNDSEHFEHVEDALERIEEIIDVRLTLAKAGQSPNKEPTSLLEIIKRAARNVDTTNVSIKIGPAIDEDVRMVADSSQVCSVFENLFRNAAEHAGDSPTVTIGSLSDETGFYVQDNGNGFDTNEPSKVFESGYTTSPNGTGFGLAIVSEVADAHDWGVAATQSPYGGAKFEFYISESDWTQGT